MLFAKLSAFAATDVKRLAMLAATSFVRVIAERSSRSADCVSPPGPSSSMAETLRFTAEHRRGKDASVSRSERMMFCMSRVSVYFANCGANHGAKS